MCGRYTLTRHEDVVEDLQASLEVSAASNDWWKPRFNVAPTQPAPVITLHDGVRTIEMMRWGLVPFWATAPGKKAPLMINARAESLDAKAFFRDAMQRKRCLVPADGFFEWRREGKVPKPVYFHPRSHAIFAFAGLWARSRTSSGAEQHSFTIITGKPNELIKQIHDRMPIVLDPSTYAAWLDPSLDAEGARALLGVPPVGDWTGEPVSTWVNKADHDDPKCIEPELGEDVAQGSLFK
jgi:putative SOS response-associated peptidase YedK